MSKDEFQIDGAIYVERRAGKVNFIHQDIEVVDEALCRECGCELTGLEQQNSIYCSECEKEFNKENNKKENINMENKDLILKNTIEAALEGKFNVDALVDVISNMDNDVSYIVGEDTHNSLRIVSNMNEYDRGILRDRLRNTIEVVYLCDNEECFNIAFTDLTIKLSVEILKLDEYKTNNEEQYIKERTDFEMKDDNKDNLDKDTGNKYEQDDNSKSEDDEESPEQKEKTSNESKDDDKPKDKHGMLKKIGLGLAIGVGVGFGLAKLFASDEVIVIDDVLEGK
jgi:hypothetical protein